MTNDQKHETKLNIPTPQTGKADWNALPKELIGKITSFSKSNHAEVNKDFYAAAAAPRPWKDYIDRLGLEIGNKKDCALIAAVTGLTTEALDEKIVAAKRDEKAGKEAAERDKVFSQAQKEQLDLLYKIVTAIDRKFRASRYSFMDQLHNSISVGSARMSGELAKLSTAEKQRRAFYFRPYALNGIDTVMQTCAADPATAANVLKSTWVSSLLPPLYLQVSGRSKLKGILGSAVVGLLMTLAFAFLTLLMGVATMAILMANKSVSHYFMNLGPSMILGYAAAIGYGIVVCVNILIRCWCWATRSPISARSPQSDLAVFFAVTEKIIFFPITCFLAIGQSIYLSYKIGPPSSYDFAIGGLFFKSIPLSAYFSATAFRASQLVGHDDYRDTVADMAKPKILPTRQKSAFIADALPVPGNFHATNAPGDTKGDEKSSLSGRGERKASYSPRLDLTADPEERRSLLRDTDESAEIEMGVRRRHSSPQMGLSLDQRSE